VKRIDRSALLPYPAAQLFQLVNDIEAYPAYMDGCVGAEILYREQDLVEARLDLAQGGISQSFSTRNRHQPPDIIHLELLEGPFEHFTGRWQFQQLGEAACKVSLKLEFRMNSRLLGLAASRLFETVALDLIESVTQRAQEIYGIRAGALS
jgi:ribosome-associated toxin RatA of RatAB toxin-antitoxin module